jgi:hypothetical protein
VFERLCQARRGVRGGLQGGRAPARGFGAAPPKKNFTPERHISRTTFYLGDFLAHGFFFSDGFLFIVKELGFWTNPGHWVRVLDAAGSYMYILL